MTSLVKCGVFCLLLSTGMWLAEFSHRCRLTGGQNYIVMAKIINTAMIYP